MDSLSSSGGSTQPPSNRAPGSSGQVKSDNAGISHPTTYDSKPTYGEDANVKPSASEPVSAATLQGKTSTPDSKSTSTSAPSTSKKLDTETHAHPSHSSDKKDGKSARDDEEEVDNKPRKDHETTTREIKATQEKAMAGTHPAEKEGEALRGKEDKVDSKEGGGHGLEPHGSHSSHHHEEGGEHEHEHGHEHEKAGLKEKLMAKVHKN